MDADGWHIVGADGDSTDGSQACSRPCTPAPPPAAAAAAALSEGVREEENAAAEDAAGLAPAPPPASALGGEGTAAPGVQAATALPPASDEGSAPCSAACCSSTDVASPASERLADSVLGQPFPPATVQPVDKPSPVAALSPFQAHAAAGPLSSPGGAQDEAVVGVRSQELETVMGLQELSGEGSLEGFHDSAAGSDDELSDNDSSSASSTHNGSSRAQESSSGGGGAQRAGGPLGLLSWIEQGLGALSSFLAQLPSRLVGVWRTCTAELQEEVSELRRVLAATRQYLGQEVSSVSKGSTNVTKVVRRRIPRASTLVPLLCVSTALACCGLVHFMLRCQRLNHSMQQRERELNRLFFKVLNLQEALRRPRHSGVATPVLRHTGIVPAIAVSSYML